MRTLTTTNSTIIDNTVTGGCSTDPSYSCWSATGGGVANRGTFNARNTIIARNTAPLANGQTPIGPDCAGPLTSQGYNLIQNPVDCTMSGDTTGNLVRVDPHLGALQDNGSSTATHALLPGSPARDAANPAVPGSGGTSCEATDQRGVSRPLDGNGDTQPRCDIGAYEAGATNPNKLLNAGFEADANADGKPDSWSTNGAFTRSAAVKRTGSYAGKHAATDNRSYAIFQDVGNLTPGTTYNMSSWVNIPATSDAFTFQLLVRWKDGTGALLGTSVVKNYTDDTNGSWSQATASVVAPANSVFATVRMDVSSLNATLYVDEVVSRPVVHLQANGGFEADANEDGKPDNWSVDPRFTRSTTTVRSGSAAGQHRATDNGSYTVFQDVRTVVPGTPYNVSSWVSIPPTSDVFGMTLVVRWKNSTGGVISTSTIKAYTAPTNGWDLATGSVVAPPGSAFATLRMDISSLNATVYVDDLVFGP